MVRKTINKIASSKTFLIIVSCIASVLLWMYVVNVENTDTEKTFTGLVVNYVGEDDILSDRQLIVTNKDDQTVSLTLYGKRSVVSSIDKKDIKVSVDLTDIKNTGTVERVYSINLPSNINEKDVYIINKEPTYVSVTIDKLSSKTVDIKAQSSITVEDGYLADPIEFNPNTITVSGPEDVISKVSYAQINIERENLSKTVTSDMEYMLMDEDGNQVSSNEIETDTDHVEVTIPIVMCKEVALTVDLVEGGGATKDNAVVSISPPSITLSGDPEVLASMNQIFIGSIDLSQFASSTTETFTIPISNDITNLSGITEATVTVNIKNLDTKRVVASNIEFTNVSDGYSATAVTQYLEVTVRGPSEIIDMINSYNVKIVCDLSELENAVGRYAVAAKVSIDGYSEAGVVGDYKVVVSLEEGSINNDS